MTAKILLTGGLGYIGSNTCIELISAGYDAVILDNYRNSKPSVGSRLNDITGTKIKVVEADVLDRNSLNQIFKANQFDAVIHFAGLKAVGESVQKPLEYIQTNVTGMLNVLSSMQEFGVNNFVFSSSATVYCSDLESPLREGMPLGFTNPYGYTKMACEEILDQARLARPELKTGILRYFNPAGAHVSGLIGEDPNDIPNNLMPYIQRVAMGDFEHLRVFGDDYDTPDGTGIRDYIHVTDLAIGHVASLEALFRTHESHLVNLGRGHGTSVLEMLVAYNTACGRELPYKIYPRRAGDVATTFASVELARDLLGFEATRGIDEICASSWNWINTGAKSV